jgi:hypothetical protein
MREIIHFTPFADKLILRVLLNDIIGKIILLFRIMLHTFVLIISNNNKFDALRHLLALITVIKQYAEENIQKLLSAYLHPNEIMKNSTSLDLHFYKDTKNYFI